jgi:hypothetical protein
MQLRLHVVFAYRKTFNQKMLLDLVEKIKSYQFWQIVFTLLQALILDVQREHTLFLYWL